MLSKSDKTGEVGFKRVKRLFRNQTRRLTKVTYKLASSQIARAKGRTQRSRSGIKSKTSSNSDDSDSDGSEPSISSVTGTPGHDWFSLDRGWIDACELKVGERLVSGSGETLEVVSVETWAESAPVYNFEVEDWHTYFVADDVCGEAVWVHNDGCWHGFTVFRNKFPHHDLGPAELFDIKRLVGGGAARGNYVVLEDGTLILGRQFDVHHKGLGGGHIDLTRGKPVLAAGEFKVYNGMVKKLNNASGHYLPRGLSAKAAAIKAFEQAGFTGAARKYKETFTSIPILPDKLNLFGTN